MMLLLVPAWRCTGSYYGILTFLLVSLSVDRIPLRGLKFPYAFEITPENLVFPLTKAAWDADPRSVIK